MRRGRLVMGTGGVTVGLLLIYKIVTDILYIEYVFPIYRYMKLTANPNGEDAAFAWLVYVVILVLFRPILGKPFGDWKFSDYVLLVLLLFTVVPGLSMCGAGAFPQDYTRWFFLYWVLFFAFAKFFSGVDFCVSAWMGSLSMKERRMLLYCGGLIVAVAVVAVFFGYGGKLFFSGLLSEDVYTVRADWKRMGMPLLLNYVLANASIVLLFLAMYFLQAKRYPEAAVLFAVEYMHFSCGANKMVLLSAVICVVVYMTRKWISQNVVSLSLIGVVVLGMLLWDIRQNVSIIALLYRNSFETNFLSFCYWDFFQTHAPFWDAFSTLPTEDRGNIPFLISDLYFGKSSHANNGLVGAAFMMAGAFGTFLSPVLWNLFLHMVDRSGSHIEEWIKFSLGVSWAVTMMNSAMTTSMLSHGGVALLVLGYLSKAVILKSQEKIGQPV